MKKVIIVGGGIAGLTAGIYLRQAGFETEIYEKNVIAGGQCTGWDREGYHIDNCIHWLTGTKEGSDLNTLWKTIGALDETVELIKLNEFYSADLNGDKITLWSDLEKTRKEMLKLSPEDEREINKFIDYTKLCESMKVPVAKPFDMMNPIEFIKLGMSMSGMAKVLKEYGGIDIEELANRFKHPLIRNALKAYMAKGYQAYALLVSYATVTSGNGDIPSGGSLAMAMRIIKKYEELGGKLFTNKAVEKVVIDGKRATGVQLRDNTFISGDYVICACDTNYTFSQLIDYKYMPIDLQAAYRERCKYPVISGFQMAFALDGVFQEIAGTNFFDCESFMVAYEEIEYMSIRNYDYEASFAPKGKSVIQSNISQSEKSYEYWENLYKNNKEKYRQEKMIIEERVLERIIKKYPFLEGKIHVLDSWTPITYNRYCNSFHGSYMGFIITKNAKDQRTKGEIKGLSNVMLASQWLMGPGGLPVAAAMGKFSAQRIMKREKKNIYV